MCPPLHNKPILLAILFLVQLLSFKVMAAEPPGLALGDTTVYINAETMEYDTQANVVKLKGQVTVNTGEYEIKALEMSIDVEDRTIHALTNVKIRKISAAGKKEILSAEEAWIEIPGDRAYVINGRMVVPWQMGQVTVWGDKLKMLDEHTFRMEAGGFTPCRCRENVKPDWAVKAKKMEADTERALKMKHARILIRGCTLFYVPYFSYPLGSERRSGFLLPEISESSVNGYEVTLPYYQVLGRSADLTFYPSYLEERGAKGGMEFRYNLGEPAEGEAEVHGMRDTTENEDRWAVTWEHRSNAEWGGEFKADVNLISDNEYLSDFDDLRGVRYSRALESRIVGAYHRTGSNATMEFSWFDDLMGADIRDTGAGPDADDQMIQRLPEVRYSLLTRRLAGPIFADVAARAAYYYTEDEDMGNGVRAEIMPRIVYPAKWADAMEVYAAAGWREIFYEPDEEYRDSASGAGGATMDLRLSTPLEKFYAGNKAQTRYRHLIEPTIIYAYQEETEQADDPFFRAMDTGEEINLAGVNIESRLFKQAKGLMDESLVKEINRIEITQFYDFTDEEFTDLRAEIRLGPALRLGSARDWGTMDFRLNGYYGWEDNEITRLWAQARYADPRGDYIGLGYLEDSGRHKSSLYTFVAAPASDIFADAGVKITRRIRLNYRSHYSLEYEMLTLQEAGLDYVAKQQCWGVNFLIRDRLRPDVPEEDHEVKTYVMFRLQGF